MDASVIIATRDRAPLLARTLEALIGQHWPHERVEILVADNRSTDDTRAVVERAAARRDAPRIRYLFTGREGKSYAVNDALARASGRALAFTDDDVVPDPEWVGSIVRALDRPDVAFVAGRILPLWEVPPPSWMSPALHGVLAIPDNGEHPFAIASGHNEVVPIGANMGVRRDVVERIGGLRVDLGKLAGTLRTGEDHEFFLRMLHAGYRGAYEPGALVHHFVPRQRLDRAYFRSWLYQNGLDVAKLRRSYPWRTRHLLGLPRYLWRQAACDACTVARATLRGDEAARFAAEVRLTWLRGYARESWFRTAG